MTEGFIPLSILLLDWHAPTGVGLEPYLAGLGHEVVDDHLGRRAVTATTARQLLTAQRDAERRAREVTALADAEAERRWRAQLPAGLPADRIPDGMSPAMAMVAEGERDSQPRRRTSVLEDALANDGAITYRPIGGE